MLPWCVCKTSRFDPSRGEDAIPPLDRTQTQERGLRVNEQIRITPVRLINGEGAMLGVVPTGKAMELAREAGLDLVEVRPEEEGRQAEDPPGAGQGNSGSSEDRR